MKHKHFILTGVLLLLLGVCRQEMFNQGTNFQYLKATSAGLTILQVPIQTNSGLVKLRISIENNKLGFGILDHYNLDLYHLAFHSVDSVTLKGSACKNPGLQKIESQKFEGLFAFFIAFFTLQQFGNPLFKRPVISKNSKNGAKLSIT